MAAGGVDELRGSFGPPILGSVPLFVILGILTLAAWNFYLTAVGFFELWFPGHQWAFVASMTYQAMNVVGTTTMVKVGQKIPFKPAYVMALVLQLLMILAMPMLAFWSPEEANDDVVTPSTWGFAAALACCAVLGLAESCFTSLICGLAGSTGDPKLMGAIMTGQGIVGVVPPILMLSLKFLSGDPMKWKYEVVFCFFGTCAALQALGVFLVRYVPTFHQENRHADATMVEVVSIGSFNTSEPADPARQLISGERSFGPILKDVMPQLVNVTMIFVVTFVVFPGVAASWSPQLEFFVSKGALGKDWYTTLVVGIFQIFDVVGRSTPKVLEKIGVSPKRLGIPVWLRLAFIPAFMLLQRRPNSIAAPWQDLLAFAVMALFALTNGWCSTLAMIYGPQQVTHPAEQHRAGVIMELGLILGIFAGSVLALLTQLGLH
ncbi:ENT3 [Symbiodinium sp. CCMP2456]|nr:ENT3 [Symbiodinium sp. CCMP2456]